MADGRRPRRAARGGSRPPLSFAAPLCAALLLALAAGAAASDDEWQVVTDLLSPLPGVEVSIVGPPQQAFARPPPRSLDPHLLADFGPQLNLLQDVSADGDNLFTDVHAQVG